MKGKPIINVILSIFIGGFIVWFLCCRKCHKPHDSHTFKIWKGYLQIDSTKESEFSDLKIVKFLKDSYYLSDGEDLALVDSMVYFLHVARNLPTEGSPYQEKPGYTIPDSIDLISIVDRDYLDKYSEFIRCRTTGKYGCFPEFLVDPLDTLHVQKAGVDKILLRLTAIIHSTGTYAWGYLELTPAEYPVIISSTTPDATGTCLSLVVDSSPVYVPFDNGNSYSIFIDYELR